MEVLTTNAKEEGAYTITATYTDEDGDAMTPNSVNWKLTDTAGNVINSRSAETETPGTSNDITLSGDDLAVTYRGDVKRILTIWGTYDSSYGTDLKYSDEVGFNIDELIGIT